MLKMNSVVEHRQLQRSGYAIHYFVSGQVGNPLIVLVHPVLRAESECILVGSRSIMRCTSTVYLTCSSRKKGTRLPNLGRRRRE
jgi:hypothetical protein